MSFVEGTLGQGSKNNCDPGHTNAREKAHPCDARHTNGSLSVFEECQGPRIGGGQCFPIGAGCELCNTQGLKTDSGIEERL